MQLVQLEEKEVVLRESIVLETRVGRHEWHKQISLMVGYQEVYSLVLLYI